MYVDDYLLQARDQNRHLYNRGTVEPDINQTVLRHSPPAFHCEKNGVGAVGTHTHTLPCLDSECIDSVIVQLSVATVP